MKRIAKKREPQQHPLDEVAQSAADAARIAVTLGLMALDGLVGKLGYELVPKDSVLVAKRPIQAVPKRKAKAKVKKAKAKPA